MFRSLTLTVMLVAFGLAPPGTRAATQSSQATEDRSTATDQSTTDKSLAIAHSTSVSGKTSDVWITTKTKLALLADDKVSSADVHVTTQQGVVTLTGKVESNEAKQAAEADAQKIDGAQKVVNRLVVVPKAAQKAVEG